GLLTRGLQLAVADRPIRNPALDPRALDPLNAVGALLHHPAGPHRHVRIHHHLLRRGLVLGVMQIIEAANLVWTIVGAVARAHAAVVDHLVEALVAVDGGVDRADVLTGSAFAVHARDRLHNHARLFDRTAEISVDPPPVHLPAPAHLLLADHWDVVFRLAGDHAGAAAGAAAEVDGHSPAIGGFVVIHRVMEGLGRSAQLVERS